MEDEMKWREALAKSKQLIENFDIIQNFERELSCGICLEIVSLEKDPVELNCCGNVIYCNRCISEVLKANGVCPYCTKKGEI